MKKCVCAIFLFETEISTAIPNGSDCFYWYTVKRILNSNAKMVNVF